MAVSETPVDEQAAAGRERRPAIVAVDDEPAVLAAVSRELPGVAGCGTIP